VLSEVGGCGGRREAPAGETCWVQPERQAARVGRALNDSALAEGCGGRVQLQGI
jgi:hypothetical protein